MRASPILVGFLAACTSVVSAQTSSNGSFSFAAQTPDGRPLGWLRPSYKMPDASAASPAHLAVKSFRPSSEAPCTTVLPAVAQHRNRNGTTVPVRVRVCGSERTEVYAITNIRVYPDYDIDHPTIRVH